MVRQGGPGVCAGEGAGSTSEAPEASLATGEASSSEEEQGCSRAQLRTRAASLSRLAVGEGSAGLTGEGVAGGAGEGGMLTGMLAEEVSASRSWRVVQRARAGWERTVGESTVPGWLEERLERRLGQGGLSAACHGSCGPPARVEGLADFLLDVQAGYGVIAAVEAG